MNEYLTIVVDGKRYGYRNAPIDGPLLSNIADHFAGGKLTEATIEVEVDGAWHLNLERTFVVRTQLEGFWQHSLQGVEVLCPHAT